MTLGYIGHVQHVADDDDDDDDGECVIDIERNSNTHLHRRQATDGGRVSLKKSRDLSNTVGEWIHPFTACTSRLMLLLAHRLAAYSEHAELCSAASD